MMQGNDSQDDAAPGRHRPALPPALLIDGPPAAPLTLALAHGAGAPMDTPFLTYFAERAAAAGYRVVRFEFPYMAARRHGGRKRPPDRTDVLVRSWREVVAALSPARLVIGGKSLGGRIASLVADDAGATGLVCLGYPFHPPGKPAGVRLDPLKTLTTPTLIVQGTRDPFGDQTEVAAYPLSPAITVHWLADGDHDFRPRAGSGHSTQRNLDAAVDALLAFLAQRRRSA